MALILASTLVPPNSSCLSAGPEWNVTYLTQNFRGLQGFIEILNFTDLAVKTVCNIKTKFFSISADAVQTLQKKLKRSCESPWKIIISVMNTYELLALF